MDFINYLFQILENVLQKNLENCKDIIKYFKLERIFELMIEIY